jgi:hypothetical protein
MAEPSPAEVRSALAPLDAKGQKIVAGLLTVMIKHPQKVRDREWVAEQLTHLVLLAGDIEADSVQDGVAAVQGYLQEHAEALVTGALLLFQRVGLDMAPRAAEGFTFEEAMQQGLSYFAPQRDLGEQPLARLMAERGLKPADLVDASTEQLTHKMVSRAMKGRRLTANTMDKVHRAWNLAAQSDDPRGALFDYKP